MHMVRLVYVSRMTEECDTEALQKVLKISRSNNTAREITGILCYDPAFFMQCLEGPREAVNQLYSEIQRDPRHKDVVLLEYREVADRKFADWSMAFVAAGDISPQTFETYGGKGKFDPYTLSAADASRFLVQLAAKEKTLLSGQ